MNEPQNRIVQNYHSNHRDLYKSPVNLAEARRASCQKGEAAGNSPGGEGAAMSWRSAYKKRCLEESKKSRQKLLHKFRNLQLQEPNKKSDFGMYLDDELRKICLAEADGVVSIDEAVEIYSQIRAEMMQSIDLDASKILEELDLIAKHDEENVLGVDKVVCPLCQKETLEMDAARRSIECRNYRRGVCTLKFDLVSTNVRDLDDLSLRLQARVQQHPCSEVPKFLFQFLDADEFEHSNSLLVYCDHCGFMQNIF